MFSGLNIFLPTVSGKGEERGKRESIGSRIYIGSKERGEPDRKIGREKDLERTLQEQMEDIESEIIRETLRRCCGNVTQAAKNLGCSARASSTG